MKEYRSDKSNRILILGRSRDTNLGDVVIVDSCSYLVNEVIKGVNGSLFWRRKRPFFLQPEKIPRARTANVLNGTEENVSSNMNDYDKIVFPGGGINSLKITGLLLDRLAIKKDTWFYFNGIGVHPVRHYLELATNIETVLNDPRVHQITTRGDLAMTKEYVTTEKPYPILHVTDPAICCSEAYKVTRDEHSETIGIGPIRPEIFAEQNASISEEEVYDMYGALFKEADKRGYSWKVFCNGTVRDYEFAQEVLEKFGYSVEDHLLRRPTKAVELVEDVASFKGVIAARFHANIIAASLMIPSIALVWNVKMRGFSNLIGCSDRYIEDRNKLLDANYLLDSLEKATKEGYDRQRIIDAKNAVYLTLKNVVLDGCRYEWYFKLMNRLRKESFFDER